MHTHTHSIQQSRALNILIHLLLFLTNGYFSCMFAIQDIRHVHTKMIHNDQNKTKQTQPTICLQHEKNVPSHFFRRLSGCNH